MRGGLISLRGFLLVLLVLGRLLILVGICLLFVLLLHFPGRVFVTAPTCFAGRSAAIGRLLVLVCCIGLGACASWIVAGLTGISHLLVLVLFPGVRLPALARWIGSGLGGRCRVFIFMLLPCVALDRLSGRITCRLASTNCIFVLVASSGVGLLRGG